MKYTIFIKIFQISSLLNLQSAVLAQAAFLGYTLIINELIKLWIPACAGMTW